MQVIGSGAIFILAILISQPANGGFVQLTKTADLKVLGGAAVEIGSGILIEPKAGHQKRLTSSIFDGRQRHWTCGACQFENIGAAWSCGDTVETTMSCSF